MWELIAIVAILAIIVLSYWGIYSAAKHQVKSIVKQEVGVSNPEIVERRKEIERDHQCRIHVLAKLELGEDASFSECDTERKKLDEEVSAEVQRIKRERAK